MHMDGILNGRHPDSADLARAPQLAILVALHAASRAAHLTILAAHPTLRRLLADAPAATPLDSAASDILDTLVELRVRICRYAGRLGAERLWRL